MSCELPGYLCRWARGGRCETVSRYRFRNIDLMVGCTDSFGGSLNTALTQSRHRRCYEKWITVRIWERSGHARGGSEAEGFRELAEAEPRLEDTALLHDFSRTFAAAILSTHDSIDVLRCHFLDGYRLVLASNRM